MISSSSRQGPPRLPPRKPQKCYISEERNEIDIYENEVISNTNRKLLSLDTHDKKKPTISREPTRFKSKQPDIAEKTINITKPSIINHPPKKPLPPTPTHKVKFSSELNGLISKRKNEIDIANKNSDTEKKGNLQLNQCQNPLKSNWICPTPPIIPPRICGQNTYLENCLSPNMSSSPQNSQSFRRGPSPSPPSKPPPRNPPPPPRSRTSATPFPSPALNSSPSPMVSIDEEMNAFLNRFQFTDNIPPPEQYQNLPKIYQSHKTAAARPPTSINSAPSVPPAIPPAPRRSQIQGSQIRPPPGIPPPPPGSAPPPPR